jgi:hypothetical protein
MIRSRSGSLVGVPAPLRRRAAPACRGAERNLPNGKTADCHSAVRCPRRGAQ